jgi:hypothetical protein
MFFCPVEAGRLDALGREVLYFVYLKIPFHNRAMIFVADIDP